MKSALVLLGLAAVATAHNLPVPSDEVNAKNIDAEFQAKAQFDGFKTKFNKQYSSKHEESARYGVFRRNLIRIAQLNKLNENGGGSNDVFGVTAFSDLTPKEFAATHLGYKPTAEHRQARKHVPVYDADADVNTNIIPGFGNGTIVDWRTKGAVSAVKDQGQCGSCWAFSATEQLESNWFLAKGTLPVLAPQQIVSCDTVDQGCDGGWPHSAYDYVKKAGGQDTEASYPYTSGKAGVTGKCKVKTNSFAASLTGYTYATTPCHTNSCNKQDETTLSNNVASKGPASVCVNAAAWQSYQKGVMTPKACGGNGYDDLDHCVQLVGFNDEAASPYWIVRNSWNTNWGLEGFIYLEMGHNTCGIANEATFVTI